MGQSDTRMSGMGKISRIILVALLSLVGLSVVGVGTAGAAPTVPSAPSGVSATPGNGSATVTWSVPASNGGSAILNYTVTSTPGSITCTTPLANPKTCTVTGLTNGTAYTFTVAATNAVGTGPDSTPSAAVTPAATAPGAPTGVTATAGPASATVSWTPGPSNGSPILNYIVSSTPASAGCAAAVPATTCTVVGLTAGKSYVFFVTAHNVVGTGPFSASSNSVTPTPGGVAIKGYWMATSHGVLLTNGAAVNYGSPAGLTLAAPIVGFAPTPDRRGYWFVAR